MKKSTTRTFVFILVVIVGVVGYFAYLSGKSRDAAKDAAMTATQIVLSRDLQNNYPPTVKEVVKYYADIQKCFYTEGCTEEEVEQLGMKARELYDADLLAINDVTSNLLQLKAEVDTFQKDGRQITAASVASAPMWTPLRKTDMNLRGFTVHTPSLTGGRAAWWIPYICCAGTRTGGGRYTAGIWRRTWIPEIDRPNAPIGSVRLGDKWPSVRQTVRRDWNSRRRRTSWCSPSRRPVTRQQLPW